jgi:cadmium resistance protein CadD (predicted permease)
MFLKYLALGFSIKIITSIDDALTRIPIVAKLTKTRMGRIAFSTGTLLALSLVIILAYLFSALIKSFPYANYIAGGLIFLLAIALYFDLFLREKSKKRTKKHILKTQKIPTKKFFRLVGTGFIVSLITLIDDAIVFVPLFLANNFKTVVSIIGIFIAAILQIIIVIYFAKKIQKIKHKKEIGCIGLIILSILVVLGTI